MEELGVEAQRWASSHMLLFKYMVKYGNEPTQLSPQALCVQHWFFDGNARHLAESKRERESVSDLVHE
jgi:hypothetical protein